MYLTAHRIRRIKGNKAEVGINAFLHRHLENDLPKNMRFNREETVDQIVHENIGKLVAESVDLVPGGSSVLSFIDIVGGEDLDKERIQEFLDLMEPDIKKIHYPITKTAPDMAIKFGIAYGLQGHETREYRALAERALRLFESPEPPKWRSENPWIVIECARSDCQQTFSLSPATAKQLQQIHDKPWIPARVSVDRHTKHNVELIFGDLIQHIAPILTDLTLEQIASQGGLILCDSSSQKKIKWPELKEL